MITKILLLLTLLFLGVGTTKISAQDLFLWTNATGDSSWTTPGNWIFASGDSLYHNPAYFYPGRNIPQNPTSPGLLQQPNSNDVACFGELFESDCYIPEGMTIRVGGLITHNFEANIYQGDRTRMLFAENLSGAWNSTIIESGVLDSTGVFSAFAGQNAYQFGLSFSPGYGYYAGESSGLAYDILIGIPFCLSEGSIFRASSGVTLVRHDMNISGGILHNSGSFDFNMRSGDGGVRNYTLQNVNFWDVTMRVSGSSPRISNFIGSEITIENNLTTSGGGSYIRNGKLLLRGNMYIEESSSFPTYTSTNSFGNLSINLIGENNQMIQSAAAPTAGVIPNLCINKDSGTVIIDGLVTIQDSLRFVKGIVYPLTPSLNQLELSRDKLILNSGSKAYGTSHMSYCEGPIQKIKIGSTEVLPVGKNGFYKPITLHKNSDGAQSYTVEYFAEESVYGTDSLLEPIETIATCHVWSIQKDHPGSANFNIGLAYSASSCIDGCIPVVTKYNQEFLKWETLGNDDSIYTFDGYTTLRSNLSIEGEFDINVVTLGTITEDVCDMCDVTAFASYSASGGDFEFYSDPVIGDSTVILSYNWNFNGEETSIEENPSHTFASAGVKMITLTISGISGTTLCEDTYIFFVFSNPPGTGMIIPRSPGAETPEEALRQAQQVASLTESEVFIEIYPNPTTGLVNIVSNNIENSYAITTINGELVSQGILKGSKETIDISGVSSGLYLLNITNGVTTITKKLIIQFQ